jgi:DNA-binding transcriptional LysR family regulator
MVDYNRIALFVRVVRAGSFTAAAAEVGLPKSSVSRSVSRLEQELGVRLLQRTTRKLALTDAGHSYYESVRENVAALESAEEAARAHGAAPTGIVRMTAAPDFVTFAPLLAQFQRQYPGIRLDLTLTSRVVDLVSESVDLAVRAGRLPDSSLIARRIGSTDGALMASPDYLRRRGRPRSFAELVSHEWVLYRAAAGRTSLTLEGPGGPQTLEVQGAQVADDMAFCCAAAEAGAGIALLPIPTAHAALVAGRLELVLPAWRHTGGSVFVVLPSGRQVPARVALLRDFLIERLGRELARTQERCDRARQQPAAVAQTRRSSRSTR